MAETTEVKKLTVLGTGSVGKSALTATVCGGVFSDTYDPTIEDLYRQTFEVNNVKRAVDIVDTAGQDEFLTMLDQWMREGDGFLLVYSITDRDSFVHVKGLVDKIARTKGANSQTPIVIVGNKCDLSQDREVPEDEGKAFASKFNYQFFETSALKQINNSACFMALLQLMFAPTTTTKPFKPKPRKCTIL